MPASPPASWKPAIPGRMWLNDLKTESHFRQANALRLMARRRGPCIIPSGIALEVARQREARHFEGLFQAIRPC